MEDDSQLSTEDGNNQATTSRLSSSQTASSQFTLRSKATTVQPGQLILPTSQEKMDTLFAPSVAESKSSMASSYAGNDLRVDIPSRPKNDDGEELEQFECPYCLLTKSIYNDEKWKKHVLEDLQPYVCTYADCELYDHFFDSRDAWFQHETQLHRTKWCCNIDSHLECGSEGKFLLHMSVDHGRKFNEAQFSLVRSMFRQPTKSLEGTCHLCYRESKNLRSHLSRHLQQIALFALPRVNETAGSGQAERDTRSSRRGKRRIDDGESSGSCSSSSIIRLSDQQHNPNDSDSATSGVEYEYDEGEAVPDIVEDQDWDSVTDMFSKGRESPFRRLQVLIFEMNKKDRDEMVSLVGRLQGEATVAVGDQNITADVVNGHTSLDAIIIGDAFSSGRLHTSIRQICDVTKVPIIIVRRYASNLDPLPGLSNWTEFFEPSQGDIEEALVKACHWAPPPPLWQSTISTHIMGSLPSAAAVINLIEIIARIRFLCSQYDIRVKDAKDDIERVQRKVTDITHVLEQIQQFLDRQKETHTSTSRSQISLSSLFYQELEDLRANLEPLNTSQATRRTGVSTLPWPITSNKEPDIAEHMKNGTIQWFLNAPEVMLWFNKANSILFCPGLPGAGKTVVAATMIHHLLNSAQQSSHGVAYMYCNYKSIGTQTEYGILSAILRQLVRCRLSTVEYVAMLWLKHVNQGTTPSLSEIYSTLQDVLKHYPTVYIVIDALDECGYFNHIRFLAKLQDFQAGCDVRLMVTSRFIPTIQNTFKDAMKLEVRPSKEDIKRFIAS
ncbi:hypothetical protein GQ44DRAFT_773663 [Phaeosphaeriaceae sp. PMI808]|nr:hypothetical protein GQ44DRAFT_773663 [Phaeosphaeriaceae sp. PMI808]